MFDLENIFSLNKPEKRWGLALQRTKAANYSSPFQQNSSFVTTLRQT
jgi:hypothetical protein